MPDIPTTLAIQTRQGKLEIPTSELDFTTSRSSGPGGQNVNKVETRVTLIFDLDTTDRLTEEQQRLVREHLATRITKAGLLRVTAQKERSQAANREIATERFVDLLEQALNPDPRRKPTKIPRRSKRKRLQAKKRRSEKKRLRQTPPREDRR